ncbi:MAG TPA: glycerol-3-phosphate dehydrogenase/oxidase [Dictyobacter sp.]|jgi:glycerol-3-phosphate dehydrogenase|nr:glycerol-3-phosphate dehydrogenase/oxidase [Dictyobacter sp.]
MQIMDALSSTNRPQNLEVLANTQFDVLVIGGGITGAGVALDAVARGYRVALVEKSDFASGTSSKSTKLVHGGIRYLPNFDFSLVHEALVERGLLLQNAPYLVTPVGFVLPIYEGDRHPVGMPFTTPGGVGLNQLLRTGLWMYDTLAGRRNIKRHYHLTRAQMLQQNTTLLPDKLKEGFVYYDAQTNDARLTMAIMRTAARYGATIVNYAQVTAFESDGKQLTGARVHDRIDNQTFIIRARNIVNATGIYADQVEAMTGTASQVQIEPSKGVHLVLSREKLQLGENAIVFPETEDKRVLFLVPWESRAIFGTTDTGTGDLDHPIVSPADISYLLKYLNRYLTVHFTEEDIISTYAGYRPLVKPATTQKATARLSRSHVVLEHSTGLITVVGGKLTTYRRMAQDTVDMISKRDHSAIIHPTKSLPLQGSAAWKQTQQELRQQGPAFGLNQRTIDHLIKSYGSEARIVFDLIKHDTTLGQLLITDLPYIKAEVIYACRYEMAMTPTDVLARRTSIILEDKERGQGIVEGVAALMGKELNWSPMDQQASIEDYHSKVRSQRKAEKSLTQHF